MKRVGFLAEERIEASTLELLASYGCKFGSVCCPPIPVEEILEAYLGLDFELDDLRELLGVSDVLGATWIAQRRVKIDQSLDPTVHPFMEGRYRFTVSHEVGHWELHRKLFPDHSGQMSLFASPEEPIVCRSGAKDPMEWQADCFAAYLLMPTTMVMSAWAALCGGLRPYFAGDEIANLTARWGLGSDERPTVAIARDLASVFRVSGQAMQIRLVRLGLIQTETPGRDLFTR